jgi:hypothetical protein
MVGRELRGAWQAADLLLRLHRIGVGAIAAIRSIIDEVTGRPDARGAGR